MARLWKIIPQVQNLRAVSVGSEEEAMRRAQEIANLYRFPVKVYNANLLAMMVQPERIEQKSARRC